MESVDTIVIGAGPAGLSCALELQDSKVDYVVFERESRAGGQLWEIDNTIRNFIGGYAENGAQTAQRLLDLITTMSANVKVNSRLEHIDLKIKSVRVNGTSYKAKTIVLATGYRPRELPLPGSSMFESDVFYETKGKQKEFSGKRVAVIGGGDMALLDSLELATICPQVYLIHRSNKLKARPDVVQAVKSNDKITMMLDTEVDSLIGQQHLSGLQVISSHSGEVKDIQAERVLIKIGHAPNTDMFRGQVNMDPTGHIFIDRNCESNVPGVFAIGDITNPGYPRIAMAAGHGIIAACRIRSIVEAGKLSKN